MSRVKLDKIDLRILRDLQDDGRITNVALADRVGISAPPCLRRVRALETRAIFVYAGVNGEALGYGVTVFAGWLNSQADNDLAAFETLVSVNEVRDCHAGGGSYCAWWHRIGKVIIDSNHNINRCSNVSVKSARNPDIKTGGRVPIDEDINISPQAGK